MLSCDTTVAAKALAITYQSTQGGAVCWRYRYRLDANPLLASISCIAVITRQYGGIVGVFVLPGGAQCTVRSRLRLARCMSHLCTQCLLLCRHQPQLLVCRFLSRLLLRLRLALRSLLRLLASPLRGCLCFAHLAFRC